MSFGTYARKVRDPNLPMPRRVSALRSAVERYRPLGWHDTLGFLEQVAGRYQVSERALLAAIDALEESRSGWLSDLRCYAEARRAAKAQGRRTPRVTDPSPTGWYGPLRAAASLHVLPLWRKRLLSTDPWVSEVEALVQASLKRGGTLRSGHRATLATVTAAVGRSARSAAHRRDHVAHHRAQQVLTLLRFIAAADPLAHGTPELDEVRTAYDTVAESYAAQLRGVLATMPFDRAMLAAFADLVRAGDGGPVADLGCGPGHVTVHLARELGLPAFGVDLSPRMVTVARRAYPELRFDVGSMLALDLADGSLAGIVAWYSIIHIPPASHVRLFEEFRRVLAPGGVLLAAFQVGDEKRHITQGYGHQVSLHAYRLPPDAVERQLSAAGFVPSARLVREPEPPETTPQAYVMARRQP
jgi:ubiquinone/menaquinone biosynthesis C-methylase UbiE